MVHVDHGLLYVANKVAKQVDGHHGIGEALGRVVAYVHLAAILRAKILSEAQRLGVEPRLLQLYQYHAVLQIAIVRVPLAHCGGEVYAEHG